MREQCTTMGMGPQGHTIAGRMMDRMHGEGAHHRMHQLYGPDDEDDEKHDGVGWNDGPI